MGFFCGEGNRGIDGGGGGRRGFDGTNGGNPGIERGGVLASRGSGGAVGGMVGTG